MLAKLQLNLELARYVALSAGPQHISHGIDAVCIKQEEDHSPGGGELYCNPAWRHPKDFVQARTQHCTGAEPLPGFGAA